MLGGYQMVGLGVLIKALFVLKESTKEEQPSKLSHDSALFLVHICDMPFNERMDKFFKLLHAK